MTDLQSLITKAVASSPEYPAPLTLAASDLIRRGRHDLAAACQHLADTGKRPCEDDAKEMAGGSGWHWLRGSVTPDDNGPECLPDELFDLLPQTNRSDTFQVYPTAYHAVEAVAEALALKRSAEQSERSTPTQPQGEGPVPPGEMP